MSHYTGSVPDTARPADWRDHALCAQPANRSVDFFPHPTDAQGIAKAKAVCAACPVVQTCLLDALVQEGGSRPEYRWGVRGGLTSDQRFNKRRSIVRANDTLAAVVQAKPKRKPRKPAKCGTRPGYQKHLRDKTEICAPCRQANRDHDNRLRRTGTSKVPA